MSLLLKDPEAILDYAIDWAADYLDTDAIVESNWSITPEEPGGIELMGSQFEPGFAAVKAAGGIAGHLYRLTNHVILASGREDSRSIILRVEKR